MKEIKDLNIYRQLECNNPMIKDSNFQKINELECEILSDEDLDLDFF